MFGLRRIEIVNNTEYGICQLPCSDTIEIIHPEGFKYLVYKSPGESQKYKVLDHFKDFSSAENFLISTIQTNEKINKTKFIFGKSKWSNCQVT